MKKLLLSLLLAMATIPTFAQLGAPKITVRDTFQIVRITYNKMDLSPQDWPCTYIIEDPVYVDIAGYKYKKDYVIGKEYRVTCNGKLYVIKKYSYSSEKHYDAAYSLENYMFYIKGTTPVINDDEVEKDYFTDD